MAGYCVSSLLKKVGEMGSLQVRSFHRTAAVYKTQSGKYKTSRFRDKPITYERYNPPHQIAHRKSWNTWNTTTIDGGQRIAETLVEDIFIRKFVYGTFPKMLASDVIIKRQHNIIRLSCILLTKIKLMKLCFLVGYTEELLSHWLQCPVKMEVYFSGDGDETIYTYV